jgi:hypothetical protein
VRKESSNEAPWYGLPGKPALHIMAIRRYLSL